MIHNNILESIGNTPLITINRLNPNKSVTVVGKLESRNPGGSVKERIALSMIEAAEKSGELRKDSIVLEATSGNTGIGLAMVCAAKGYPLVITMVETFSVERRRLMRFLGAKVVLTPKEEKGTGMYQKAKELAEQNGWFFARQFETQANADIHEQTTGREIMADFEGQRLDYFVSGFGTGGTVAGVSRVLRRERPETKIILSEPANAAMVQSGIAQERTDDGEPAASHPAFNPHPIQGWTPDFIPLVLQEALDREGYDELIPIGGPESIEASRKLALEEGIFTGISGGATFATALKVAEKAPEGSVILAMLPDTGERYLSTPLFEGVEAEMSEEEIALMRSTPGYQMGG